MNTQVLSRFVPLSRAAWAPVTTHPTIDTSRRYLVPAPAIDMDLRAEEVTAEVPTETPVPLPQVSPRSSVKRVAVWRVGFLVVCAAGAALAWTAASGAAQVTETELALLLRGMAGIKGLLAVLAASLVVWRLGMPMSTRAAWAYTATVGLMFVGSALIWQLAFMGPAAALFHAGFVGSLLVAWREGRPTRRFGHQG